MGTMRCLAPGTSEGFIPKSAGNLTAGIVCTVCKGRKSVILRGSQWESRGRRLLRSASWGLRSQTNGEFLLVLLWSWSWLSVPIDWHKKRGPVGRGYPESRSQGRMATDSPLLRITSNTDTDTDTHTHTHKYIYSGSKVKRQCS